MATKKKPTKPTRSTKPTKPAKPVAATVSNACEVRQLPIELVDESPTNPRKTFTGLDELADSIKQHGQIHAVLCRPKGKRFEMVCGARRYRAIKLAKLKTIRSEIRELTDEQVIELQLVENSKRDDIHPLEEADGFKRLHDEHGYAAEEIAAKIGKSKSHVFQRMKLCELCKEGRKAFLDGKLNPSTAVLVARIPDVKLQAQACKEITTRGYRGESMSFRDAAVLVQSNYMCKLAGAGFSRTDPDLVPKAGPCAACPKRTGAQAELFDDVRSADVCTDPTCFRAKLDAHWARLKSQAKETGQKLLSDAEAKKVFQYARDTEPGYNSGFVAKSQRTFDGRKERSYGDLVKDKVTPVLARAPSGRIVELYPRAEVEKVLRKNPTPTQKREKENRKAELQAQREQAADRARAFDELLVAASQRQTDADFLRFVVERVLSSLSWQLQKALGKRRDVSVSQYEDVHAFMGGFRNGIVSATEDQLRSILVEVLCIHMLDQGFGVGLLVEACKRFGVEPPKHRPDDLVDELDDEDLDAGDDSGDDDALGEDVACRLCGCTENTPCPGGCQWVPDPEQLGELCSACLPKVREKLNQNAIEESGESFHCPGCDRDVPLESGATDDYPDLCADCANDATDRMLSQDLYVQGMRALRGGLKGAKSEQPSQAAIDATVAAVTGKKPRKGSRKAAANANQ